MTLPTAESIRDLATEQGFALCGIAPPSPSAHEAHFRRWLDEGKHGEMDYLQRNLDVRLDPRKLLDGAEAIIVVADEHPNDADAPQPGDGKIARYAWYDDYHKHMKKRLFAMADTLRACAPHHHFRGVVDTAPLLEREHAARAGLGWIGKHTLLIHPRKGSYLLLGAIVTTLPLEPDREPEADHCGTCTRCIDACPTDCITPYAVDASRCISYLTIEHRSVIDESLHEPMGDWLAGCDICQEVCPYNAKVPSKPTQLPGGNGWAFPLRDILNWNTEDRQRALQGSALKRIKLPMWKRNAIIAGGNHLLRHDDPDLESQIEKFAADPDEDDMVRATARQTLTRLETRRSESPPADRQ